MIVAGMVLVPVLLIQDSERSPEWAESRPDLLVVGPLYPSREDVGERELWETRARPL